MHEAANKLWAAMQSFGVQQIAAADRAGAFSRESVNYLSFHQHRFRTTITRLFSSTSFQAKKWTFFLHLFSITSINCPSFLGSFFCTAIRVARLLTGFISTT